jgi:hypothetical protein
MQLEAIVRVVVVPFIGAGVGVGVTGGNTPTG